MFLRYKKSQSILEYAILIAIIIAAILIMQTFMKRGVQGRLKDSSDRISGGESFSASESTILEDRAMTTSRVIHDETATDNDVRNIMNNELGTGFTTHLAARGGVQGTGADAYSATSVRGGATTSVTQARMSSAVNEAYSPDELEESNFGALGASNETIDARSVFN